MSKRKPTYKRCHYMVAAKDWKDCGKYARLLEARTGMAYCDAHAEALRACGYRFKAYKVGATCRAEV